MASNVTNPPITGANSRTNAPDYFYEFFEGTDSPYPGGRQPQGSLQPGISLTNRIVFGQRYAFPVITYEGETFGSNAVVSERRTPAENGFTIPEYAIAAQFGAGANSAGYLRAVRDKREKARYIKNFFR